MKLVLWRERHIKEQSLLLILALVTGLICGFAAQLLKMLIHLIGSLVSSHIIQSSANWLYLVCPVVGILITYLLVKYVIKENISHGVTRVLYAISRRKSRLKIRNTWASILASSVTIGFGGSVGAEGPIVLSGAAIGSNIGQAFRMSPKVLMILAGCGAAAGIAGIFRAPIAGMLFTLEVLMIDMSGATVMPLLISSITGATVAYVLEGYSAEFFFIQSEPFATAKIPYAVLLGIVCGFMSILFTKTMVRMEGVYTRCGYRWLKIVVGGAVLALLIFLFPPLYGEGYTAISNMLNGAASSVVDGSVFYIDRDNVLFVGIFILLIMLLKPVATASTNGAGGVGGTFAPSLFVGAMCGFLFAYTLNNLPFGLNVSTNNFALLGMAGVMAGVMHAPLMAIFLTAELTGGYDLFLPLLIASTIAYGIAKLFLPYSIYATRLARQGDLLTHHKDRSVLTLLKTDALLEHDFMEVHPEMTLKEMVEVIQASHRNLFPVTDADGKLVGIVLLDDIRNIMFRPDLYRKMHVSRFMTTPPAVVNLGDPMEKVMNVFDKTGAWNLPVTDDGKYVGFVSKSKILSSYRRVLRHYSDD